MAIVTSRKISDTYLELIREFPLRRITTKAEHSAAKAVILRLSPPKKDRGTLDYLNVLIDLVVDYEKRTFPELDPSNVSAVELVLHRIEEGGLTVTALARQVGIPQSNLSQMLNGKRGWSKAAIRALSKHLNIRPERFLV